MEVKNLHLICRTCLKDIQPKSGEEINSIFNYFKTDFNEIQIINMILESLNIQLSNTEQYPHYLCNDCVDKLQLAYEFRQQILQSEACLKDYLTQKSSEQIELNISQIESVNEMVYSGENLVNYETGSHELTDVRYEEENVEFKENTNSDQFEISEISLQVICLICQKHLPEESNLNHHLAQVHTVRSDYDITRPFRCENCAKAYTSMANLELHRISHQEVKPFKCDQCGKGFDRKLALSTHMAIHTGLRSHLCSECGRSFTSANILLQHRKTHSGNRRFICSICQKGFHTSNDLRIHFRMHTGEKPYLCSTCGRGFARITHLNIHLRTHSGEKPYSCSTCNRAFAQSGDLKAHIRTHTGERPYSCKLCPKHFNQSSGLASHMKSHSGIRKYSCEMCQKKFTQSGSLARHVKSHK